jgi:ADP-heptose:LPS heptosyltransferase
MKKIGVLRANAIGDVVVSLPAFTALRTTFPESEIVLIGRKSHCELFKGRSSPIDRVIALPASIQFDRPLESEDDPVIEELKREEFDMIIQLHGGGRHSNRFVKLLEPKRSIGAKTPDAETLDQVRPYAQFQHESLRQMDILRLIGVRSSFFKPEISVTESEKREGLNLLRSISPEGPYVLLNPGANDSRRRWPIRKFIEVGNILLKRGMNVFANVGPAENSIREDLKKLAPQIQLISPSLQELLGVLANCQLVISNDTGTMHLALAVKTPTVALFWYRNLLGYGPLDQEEAKVLVSWKSHCEHCGRNCSKELCHHEDSLIDEISVSEVIEASEDFIPRSMYENRN